MEQHNYNKQDTLNDLISEYEAMSQKGVVIFYKETVFSSLIAYYQQEKKYELALSVVDIAIDQHSFSALFYYKKAELLSICCRDTVFWKDAIEAIEKAESLSPLNLEIKLLRAKLLGCMGDHRAAFNLLDALKENLPASDRLELAEIYYNEGLLYKDLKQYDFMFNSLKEALLLNTRHEEALQKIWLCVELSQKYKESIALFKEIIDEDPYCQMAWFYLGHAHLYYVEYEEAIEAYEYAFIIDKEFEWAYRDCAAICLETKNYTKALECYEEALKYVTPDGDLLLHVGLCYQHLGNIKTAQSFYRRALNLDAYNDEIYFHIGECMVLQDKWTSAIHFYKRAIGIDGRREEYFAALGTAYCHLDDYEEAFSCFRKATELAPEQTEFWIKFFTFLFEVGYYQEAIEVLEEADMYAVGEELLYCKVVCLYKLGKEKDAINLLAEALIENFEKHTMMFDYVPELAFNAAFSSVINFYQGE